MDTRGVAEVVMTVRLRGSATTSGTGFRRNNRHMLCWFGHGATEIHVTAVAPGTIWSARHVTRFLGQADPPRRTDTGPAQPAGHRRTAAGRGALRRAVRFCSPHAAGSAERLPSITARWRPASGTPLRPARPGPGWCWLEHADCGDRDPARVSRDRASAGPAGAHARAAWLRAAGCRPARRGGTGARGRTPSGGCARSGRRWAAATWRMRRFTGPHRGPPLRGPGAGRSRSS